MKKLLLISLLALAGCGGGGGQSANAAPVKQVTPLFGAANSMLWNPGPNYADGVDDTDDLYDGCGNATISDMSQASYVGTPAGIAPPIYCAGVLQNPNGNAPSYFNVTYGWTQNNFAVYPGWAVWYVSGGNGTPIDFRLFNDSATLGGDPCQLHEVSASYLGWRDLTDWPGYTNVIAQPNATVFKQLYDPSTFASITATFSAKLDSASAGSACVSMPTQRIEADLNIQYFDANHKILRTDVLGVSVYNKYPAANGSAILFSDQCKQNDNYCQVILDGSKLGYPQLNSDFQTYNIEFLSLYKNYMQPPPTGTVSQLLIVSEVYSTAKSSDVVFDVTNIDLLGVPK